MRRACPVASGTGRPERCGRAARRSASAPAPREPTRRASCSTARRSRPTPCCGRPDRSGRRSSGEAGLSVERGRVRARRRAGFGRSTTAACFVAGDSAAVAGHEDLARIGVHAVKQGPVLRENVRQALPGARGGSGPGARPAPPVPPYPVAPLLVSTGGAVGVVGGRAGRGQGAAGRSGSSTPSTGAGSTTTGTGRSYDGRWDARNACGPGLDSAHGRPSPAPRPRSSRLRTRARPPAPGGPSTDPRRPCRPDHPVPPAPRRRPPFDAAEVVFDTTEPPEQIVQIPPRPAPPPRPPTPRPPAPHAPDAASVVGARCRAAATSARSESYCFAYTGDGWTPEARSRPLRCRTRRRLRLRDLPDRGSDRDVHLRARVGAGPRDRLHVLRAVRPDPGRAGLPRHVRADRVAPLGPRNGRPGPTSPSAHPRATASYHEVAPSVA